MASVASQFPPALRGVFERHQHPSFQTGLAAIDALLPTGFSYGAVHEVLVESARFSPLAFLILLAQSALNRGSSNASKKSIAWIDLNDELYPPGLLSAGLPLDRLFVLRPSAADLIRIMAECCGCKAIAATIATVPAMTQVQARRLQLAAERGGGVGLIIRLQKSAVHYAAATRWQIRSQRGDRLHRRWNLQLIHGHGGHIGQNIILEVCRETNRMRAFTPMADRSSSPEAFPVPA